MAEHGAVSFVFLITDRSRRDQIEQRNRQEREARLGIKMIKVRTYRNSGIRLDLLQRALGTDRQGELTRDRHTKLFRDSFVIKTIFEYLYPGWKALFIGVGDLRVTALGVF